LEGIATVVVSGPASGNHDIEVVDLVWKGLRHFVVGFERIEINDIEVVDLVWKGLRHVTA